MGEFLRQIFCVKDSSVENEEKTVETVQTEVEKNDCAEVFFNTAQNDLLFDISQALSGDRREALKVLVRHYQKEYGDLYRNDVFYNYDIVTEEWYCCAPLYRWCSTLEIRDLFYELVSH